MKIRLHRKYLRKGYSIGILYINGVRICETLEDEDRGLQEFNPLEVIKARKVKGETAIPIGTYQITWTFSPRFNKMLPLLNGVPGYEGIRIHCLTPDTEVLTEDGWKNLEQFKANPSFKCYSYNTKTEKAELVPINFFVEDDYNGILHCNDGKRISYAVTDEHQMYGGYKKKDGSHSWGFRKAKDVPTNATKFITACEKDGERLNAAQKTFYRILMAVVADGYILNRSMESSQVRFHFKKQRKIERIKYLLAEIGEKWSEHVDSEGNSYISLSPELSNMITEFLNPYRELLSKKDLPWDLLKLGSEDLKDLVMEYLFWDGRWENYLRCNKNMQISSTNTHTIDVLQAMATLSGLRASYKDETGGGAKENAQTCYALCLYEGQDIVSPEPTTYSKEYYNGKVWCLNNDNHTLFIRRNRRVMVIGNCGNKAKDTEGCILCGRNTEVGMVTNSRYWTNKVNAMIEKAIKRKEDVSITIHW